MDIEQWQWMVKNSLIFVYVEERCSQSSAIMNTLLLNHQSLVFNTPQPSILNMFALQRFKLVDISLFTLQNEIYCLLVLAEKSYHFDHHGSGTSTLKRFWIAIAISATKLHCLVIFSYLRVGRLWLFIFIRAYSFIHRVRAWKDAVSWSPHLPTQSFRLRHYLKPFCR